MNCAKCKLNNCHSNGQNCTGITYQNIEKAYQVDDENMKIMHAAACTEANLYSQLTRLEETVEFCNFMQAKKIGLAFCFGLKEEASFVYDYLSKFFQVESVCCKVCGMPKGYMELQQIRPDKQETMCNPIMQAQILGNAGCELNFTVGLCVGHDMLFNKSSTVPVSCIIAKDRVLSHNPAGVVYSRYWRQKLGI